MGHILPIPVFRFASWLWILELNVYRSFQRLLKCFARGWALTGPDRELAAIAVDDHRPSGGRRRFRESATIHSFESAASHATTKSTRSLRFLPSASRTTPSSSPSWFWRLTPKVGYPNDLAPTASHPAKAAKRIWSGLKPNASRPI